MAIDEKLAPLITLLWRLGVETMECCQDIEEPVTETPTARISFDTLPDATTFVALLMAGNPGYADELECLNDYPSESGFRVFVWFQPGLAAPIPTVVVELPTALITELTEGVRAHLARTAKNDPAQMGFA